MLGEQLETPGKEQKCFQFLNTTAEIGQILQFSLDFIRTTIQGDATDLVGDFHNRWRPLIKLIDPI